MINQCCIGNKKSHRGYIWKYTNSIEKHIPKKPEMEKYTKRKLYFCPICGTEVTDCTYCSHFGQAIDWSEQLSLYEIEHGRNFKGNKNAR